LLGQFLTLLAFVAHRQAFRSNLPLNGSIPHRKPPQRRSRLAKKKPLGSAA
jgi:hypothetical protein